MKKLWIFFFISLLLSLHSMIGVHALAYEPHVLAAGRYHSLFIDKNGLVWGWGNGSGLGLASDQSTPQIVFEKAVSVSTSSHRFLALREDGSTWGRGSTSFCRNNPLSESPKKVFDDVIALGGGPDADDSFVIRTDRSLWSWWSGWEEEKSDRDNIEKEYDSCLPRRILDNVEQVAMGSEHALALVRTDPATNGGKALQLMGWGSNDCWQLGDYDLGNQTTPVPINPWNDERIRDNLSIVKVAAAGTASYALTEDGTIWGWGAGRVFCEPWRRGNPEDPDTRRFAGMDNVKDISAGQKGLLALREDGTLWGTYWSIRSSQPERLIRTEHADWAFILDNVQEMSAGGFHGIALKKDGTVWTWGWNNMGQLGRSDENDNTTPIQQVVFPSPEETAIQLKKFREKMKADQQ
jgi:alpha-tubulin suppressor-like RCC1 family protein